MHASACASATGHHWPPAPCTLRLVRMLMPACIVPVPRAAYCILDRVLNRTALGAQRVLHSARRGAHDAPCVQCAVHAH
eukprot:12712920-Alexandrium_andersonii.AAC.1